MICPRCGLVNRSDRISCVHCWAPLIGQPPATDVRCADHPDVAATGRCVICQKLVCDNCGGLYQNQRVYCLEDTEKVMIAALTRGGRRGRAAPAPVAAGAGEGGAPKKRGLFGRKK